MKFLLGIAIFFAGVLMFQLVNAHWEMAAVASFLDAPTLMGFGIAIYAVIVATGQTSTFAAGVKAVFLKEHLLPKEELADAISLFKLLSKTVIYAAVLFIVIAIVLIMGNLHDWELFFANISLALLSVFYAALINLILINPVIAILEKRERHGQK